MNDDSVVLFDGEDRKQRGETQLAHEIARLCKEDQGLRLGFARELLNCLETSSASAVARALPRSGASLQIATEQSLGAVKTAWLRESGGRADLVIVGKRVLIVVELTIGAGLQPKQLERYTRHVASKLKTEAFEAGGVVLVSETRQQVGRRVSSRDHWLGQLTWRDLIPRLEDAAATDAAVEARWRKLLETVQEPGDLGDGVVGWNKGNGTVGRRNKLILKSVVNSTAHTLESGLKRQLSTSQQLDCATVVSRSGKNAASIDIAFSRRARTPALTVTVSGSRRPLSVSILVPKLHTTSKSGAAQAAAAAVLTEAAFKATSDGYLAVTRFGRVSDDDVPSAALRKELDPLLLRVVESGALDGYVDTFRQRVARKVPARPNGTRNRRR
ncbi:MAG: hypothetical protein PGN29_18170 [Gordonia paraffinivorans]